MGVLPPRLLQGHSPSGEPHCTALVENGASSGETLVNGSEPGHYLAVHGFSPFSENAVTTPGVGGDGDRAKGIDLGNAKASHADALLHVL